VIPFYERLGYVQEGDRFDEDGGKSIMPFLTEQSATEPFSTSPKAGQERQCLAERGYRIRDVRT